ncbi:MAG: hypothetical protein ABI183_02240 [Polyangiaceae bacterium]
MRSFSFVIALIVGPLAYACSSSSTPSGSTSDAGSGNSDASSGGDSGSAVSCGLTFYTSDYDKSCQAALDTSCCSQEKACVANSDCVALVACINACPVPRQDACVHACAGDAGESAPGFSQLNDIASCPTTGPGGGISCDWPNGNGH